MCAVCSVCQVCVLKTEFLPYIALLANQSAKGTMTHILLLFNTHSGPHVECPNQPNSTTIDYYVQPGVERQFLQNPYGDE